MADSRPALFAAFRLCHFFPVLSVCFIVHKLPGARRPNPATDTTTNQTAEFVKTAEISKILALSLKMGRGKLIRKVVFWSILSMWPGVIFDLHKTIECLWGYVHKNPTIIISASSTQYQSLICGY